MAEFAGEALAGFVFAYLVGTVATIVLWGRLVVAEAERICAEAWA